MPEPWGVLYERYKSRITRYDHARRAGSTVYVVDGSLSWPVEGAAADALMDLWRAICKTAERAENA